MMITHMLQHGWKRLDEDFLNPGLKPTWARAGGASEKWGRLFEQGRYVHQWIEDWEDNDNNLIRYWLRYRKSDATITPEDCNLDVVAIFVPNEVRQKMVTEAEALREKTSK